MSDIAKWIAGVIGVIVLLFIWSWVGNNGRYYDATAGFAEVHNQYKRQAELVPNLVATVEKAAATEKSIQVGVAEARAAATKINIDLAKASASPEAMKEFLNAAQQLSGALRIFATAEAPPVLQSIAGFRDLQAQLEGSQNRIATARTRWIRDVRNYNAFRTGFPGVFTAGLGRYQAMPQFEASADDLKTPAVKFN